MKGGKGELTFSGARLDQAAWIQATTGVAGDDLDEEDGTEVIE